MDFAQLDERASRSASRRITGQETMAPAVTIFTASGQTARARHSPPRRR